MLLLLLQQNLQPETKSQAVAVALDGVAVAVAQIATHSQTVAVALDGVAVAVAQVATHAQAVAVALDGVAVAVAQVKPTSVTQSLAMALESVSFGVSQLRIAETSAPTNSRGGAAAAVTGRVGGTYPDAQPEPVNPPAADVGASQLETLARLRGDGYGEQAARALAAKADAAITKLIADIPRLSRADLGFRADEGSGPGAGVASGASEVSDDDVYMLMALALEAMA